MITESWDLSPSTAGFTVAGIQTGNVGAAKILLAAGASVEARGRDANTPLALASLNGHQEVVALLLESKADANSPTGPDGTESAATPLHLAAFAGSSECLQLLLAAGADCSALDGQVTSHCLPLPPCRSPVLSLCDSLP